MSLITDTDNILRSAEMTAKVVPLVIKPLSKPVENITLKKCMETTLMDERK